MNTLDHRGGGVTEANLLSQDTVVGDIQGAVRRGYSRLLVLGPPRSRRLATLRAALGAMGYKLVVIDLGNVWTRGELDSAIRRSLRAANFYAAMRQLQRRAHKERLAVVFHHFDGSSGFPAEDHVVYRVLMEVGHHCPSPLVAFTARDAYFVGRCLRRYNSFKSYVRLISFTSDLLGIAQEADE